MPKASMTADEIDSIKETILEKALQLIIEEGYNKLSMRKIASRLGVTAASIYYYYKNKEEINLMVRLRGFEMLESMTLKAYHEKTSVENKLRAVVWAYVEFGITYPDYYDIMFNLRTPKVTDYIGTELELIATTKLKPTARKTFYLVSKLITALNTPETLHDDDILYKTIQLWSDMHGIISLYNSNLIYQMTEDSRNILNRRIEKLVDGLVSRRPS
ncbi:MAG: TetR/AcrR family transcriptional regulator [Thermodesulfobacteriota bacterium]